MLLLLLTGMLAYAPKSIELVPVKTLEAIPESAETFIQNPWDATISPEGKVYVLDLDEATVFHWDKEGKYLGNFAKRGQGPGDLMIMVRRGGPQASISTRGEEVVIYDGGLRKINRFKSDGTFIDAKIFNLPGGRTESFRPLADGNYLIHHRTFGGDEPIVKVGIFKGDGTEIKNLFEMVDTSWRRRKDGQRGIILTAFSRDVFVHYDPGTDRIIIADTDKPEAKIYNHKGELQNTITMSLPRAEVTEADRAEFSETSWIKNNRFFQPDFPEKHQLFDYVMPDKQKGFMVFRESNVKHTLLGYYVDANGKTTARIQTTLGEESNIFAADGKFLIIRTNEDGDFNVMIAEPQPETT